MKVVVPLIFQNAVAPLTHWI